MQGNHSGTNLVGDIRGWHGHGVNAARLVFRRECARCGVLQVLEKSGMFKSAAASFIY
jgi:hypothetical protein